MKRALIFSFLGAAGFHALLLFGFQLGEPARPLPAGDESAPVDLSLVAGDAEPPAAKPPPSPEPAAEPVPDPTPALEMPTVATPTPEPSPAPAAVSESAPTPVPKPPAPKPAVHVRARPPSLASVSREPREGSAPGQGNAGSALGGASQGAALGSGLHYRSHPRPEYPAQARRDRQEGVVLLKVQIGPDGRPADVALQRSSGFPLLDESAIRAVKRWTFEPATAVGLPVASQVEVPVRFNLVP